MTGIFSSLASPFKPREMLEFPADDSQSAISRLTSAASIHHDKIQASFCHQPADLASHFQQLIGLVRVYR